MRSDTQYSNISPASGGSSRLTPDIGPVLVFGRDIKNQLEGLLSNIVILEERLAPVMMPAPDEPVGGSKDKMDQRLISPLSREMLEILDNIRYLDAKITKIQKLLEV